MTRAWKDGALVTVTDPDGYKWPGAVVTRSAALAGWYIVKGRNGKAGPATVHGDEMVERKPVETQMTRVMRERYGEPG